MKRPKRIARPRQPSLFDLMRIACCALLLSCSPKQAPVVKPVLTIDKTSYGELEVHQWRVFKVDGHPRWCDDSTMVCNAEGQGPERAEGKR